MTTPKPTIGLDEIAKKTKVAVSTVSRALRNLPGIHPETRTRILRTAQSLGYNARESKSDGSSLNPRHILILTVGEETPSAYMAGLSRASLRLNIALHFHHVTRSTCDDFLTPGNLPPSLREEMISGIILVYGWPEKIVERISRRFPTVSIVHTYPHLEVDVLGIDHTGGMYALVEHLKKTGNERIGFLGLDSVVSWSRSRFSGYLEALLALNLPLSKEHVVPLDLSNLHEETTRMTECVMDGLKKGVGAWVCADDFIGYDLCGELIRRGIRIPEDVAITGFHRHPHIRHGALPQLTSTKVDSELMGFNALQQLDDRMSHPKQSSQLILMPATLVQGQTTFSSQSSKI